MLGVYGLTQPFKLRPPPFPGWMAQREMKEERERERDGISKRRQLPEVAGNLMGPYMFFHVIGNFQDVGQQSSVIQSHTAQRVALELWLSDGRQRFK